MQDESKVRLMFNIVEQWKQSGKSQSQFSSENGIPLHTFYYWVKKYRETHETHQGFAPITISGETNHHVINPRVVIELNGGIIVRVY
jgi:hypothetical protein